MTIRDDYITALGLLVPGELPLGESEKILAVNQAMKMHSRYRPRLIVEDETGDGGFDYAISDLEHWKDGFSVIKTVEYPVDDDDETPDILEDDAWTIYRKPAGNYLRFSSEKPAATESFRVTYTAYHTCTDADCTVEDYDEEAVQALSAGYFCTMLAAYYAQNQESPMGADVVDHRSKSQEYAARAKMYRKAYFDHIGVVEGKTVAASVTMDQDPKPSWQGDGLTHQRKYR